MSRDLDVQVAEKLMGFVWWTKRGEGPGFLDTPDGNLVSGNPLVVRAAEPPDEQFSDWLREVPLYSTDIVSALLVVERLKETGYGWCITYDDDPVPCNVSLLWSVDGKTFKVGGSADTIPEAVCLAAISASESPNKPNWS